ncbi:MAG TPA: cupin domain-containing protein [Povalibacter sp.]|nr:cupin domain-containing protein [Povalibacter sp.]
MTTSTRVRLSHRIALGCIVVAVLAVLTRFAGHRDALAATLAASDPARAAIMHSTVIDWNDVPPKKTDVRTVRQFFQAPTATLDELELHVTTLAAGESSHPPHQHPNEELVIIKEGTVEALVHGEWKRVGPGSVIFNASNELHALRNVGDGPATYHVINWRSARTPQAQ